MDSMIVTAMAGVLGSLVGGSATVATTWISQRTLNKRELLGAEIRTRDAVLAEAASVAADHGTYFSPNLSVEEIRMLVQSHGPDPLKSFGEACRPN